MASKSARIVVGCKLPHGLWLTVGDKSVELKGTNSLNLQYDGHGYGLTENVDSAFFDEWCKRNSQHPAITGGLIFAQETTAEARAQALDNAERKNGFEGVNPDAPGANIEQV